MNSELIPLEDFFKAYYECRKHKRNTINALKFEINYEENLIQLCNEVNTKTYTIGKSICFLVRRPKLREVFAADFRDRIIHHIIMQRLEPLFEATFIEDNYNCRKGKGVLYGVKRLYSMIKECSENYTKDCWICKYDLQGFFMTIHKPTLLNMLNEYIYKNYKEKDIDILLYLVKMVVLHHPEQSCIIKGDRKEWDRLPKNKSLFTCEKDCGIPIGNLTSQCFANFYLSTFDFIMKQKFTYYGRYVDDFFIISQDKIKQLNNVKPMRRYLKSVLNVKLHEDKIYMLHYSKGVNFIGAVVKKDRMYIANRTVANMYNKVHSLNKKHKSLSVVLRFFLSLNSYFGFMKHYLTFHIKYLIYKTLDNAWEAYFKLDKSCKKFTLTTQYKVELINNVIV